ncbi:DUF308 domain-containing protein [Flammeovirga sp. EKP202]|uniref:DUF308 domain-containing protein n=1 Tax=Flammeovirga sp. EKP202 TaxID=2770592 RepID=UPI00165FCC57|nr:DUF308 domain-containing protein [Flammeovirga sp. EKP202]MBD0405327.1 DUF308 domain-containing protein [Flammeovirga sp. EKP202]
MFKNLESTVRYWYLLLIAGITFIISGMLTFTFPIVSYVSLAVVFACLYIIEGFSEIIFSIMNRKKIKGWGWTLFYGLFSIGIGIFLVLNPGFSATVMPLYIGLLFLAKSIVGITLGSQIQKETGLGSLPIGAGVIGVILSTILIINPLFAGFSIVFTAGIAFISSGVYSIILGLEYRKLNKKFKEEKASTTEEEETDKDTISETEMEKEDEIEVLTEEEFKNSTQKSSSSKDDVIYL